MICRYFNLAYWIEANRRVSVPGRAEAAVDTAGVDMWLLIAVWQAALEKSEQATGIITAHQDILV